MSFVPGLGIVKGHGPDLPPILRSPRPPSVPGGGSPTSRRVTAAGSSCSTTRTARSSARRASSAPRPAPSSASTWAASTPRAATTSTGAPPRQYGERREESALRRSGRPVPDPTYDAVRADRHRAPLDAILEPHDYDPRRHAGHPRGDPGRLRLPAGGGAQAHQPRHRRVVRDDLRHRDLLPPAALRHRRAATCWPSAAAPAARSAAPAGCWRRAEAAASDPRRLSPDGAVRLEATACHGGSPSAVDVTLDGARCQGEPTADARDLARAPAGRQRARGTGR